MKTDFIDSLGLPWRESAREKAASRNTLKSCSQAVCSIGMVRALRNHYGLVEVLRDLHIEPDRSLGPTRLSSITEWAVAVEDQAGEAHVAVV